MKERESEREREIERDRDRESERERDSEECQDVLVFRQYVEGEMDGSFS